MTAYLTTAAGGRFELPALLSWEMTYGCGTPCDSFQVRCPWSCGEDGALARAAGFSAWEGRELVFTGVVDECEVSWSEEGSVLEVSGRGMAALLLDNEAEGMDYEVATIDNILRDHVLPYGIRVARRQAMPAAPRFVVSGGSSEWAVLYQFARYCGGVTPRFDREGRLILAGWENSEPRIVDDRTPVTALSARDRRYGVLSEVWVRNRSDQSVQKVVNQAFRSSGGRCRRIYTMPRKSGCQAMRRQGQYQLDRSAEKLLTAQAEIAIPFCAWPGELVRIEKIGWGRGGLWRVSQARVCMDRRGCRTRLELAPPDIIL